MPQLVLSIDGVEIKRMNLQKERTTLGRKPHNDIALADMVISGEHCVFELDGGGQVVLKDLDSTNGTYLNGKILHNTDARLKDQDVVGVGRIRVQFLQAADPGDFGKTSSMPLEELGFPDHAVVGRARLRVLSGSSAGLEMPVVKAVTTFGKPGIAIVAISHRRHGYYLAVIEGGDGPMLNGQSIGPDAVPLSSHDELELAGTRLQFILGD